MTVLQQKPGAEWEITHFASQFLTEIEKKYSINELELLAVVWSIENFRIFVYGTEFEVVTDHKALTTILRNNRADKTFSSRITRWVDRLLPFQFNVVHAPGRTIGIADFFSRHSSEIASNIHKIKAEEMWNNWFTVNEITRNKLVSDTSQAQNAREQPIAPYAVNDSQ